MPLNTRYFACNTYSYTMSHTAESCREHLADLGFREFELAGDDPHEGLALICCDTCRQERLVRYVALVLQPGFASIRFSPHCMRPNTGTISFAGHAGYR